MDVLPVFTERLILRRLQEKDIESLIAYRSDPEVARYQSWTEITEDEARTLIQQKQRTPFGILGAWVQIAIALRETDALIGDIGVCIDQDGQSAEIGFTLSGGHQGKGLATEAVRRVIELLFDETDIKRIEGVTDTRNTASIALLQRLGMKLEKTEGAWFKGETCHEHRFVLTRPVDFSTSPARL
jgi:Acetyltransferases, including N-acetylases of ribosomal proteins